ncbi:MAG: DUF5686 and carboxypeptidase regulatory-like domain-containing protein [Bacteroidia bacterium]|nr:DUF5686 and carboxypeptidase regulatory-like domain-containing protein [Bacteroidia bacterium]MCF8426637.1 DUF5686 and carboxypeptidase regulatory-like domain-containing protein [Bacteroidia bacterium]
MRVHLLFTYFLTLLTSSIWGQGIKGVLKNSKGEELPYVTIYSSSAKLGTNSNVNGTYQLKLPLGKQVVQFQSIDYKTLVQTVEIVNGDFLELNLVLEEQNYELREVNVNTGKENPANYIMRKAIAAAPYYRRQVLNYSAKVYVKGTGKIDSSPRLLKGIIKDQGIEIGRSYVVESINELFFQQPRTYREKVISVKSSMPFDDAPQPMTMARGSWYEEGNGEVVSPLSRQAFGVYNFILEGSFYENGKEINKIKVEPKRKGDDLFNGYVYIIEKLWCLHSCILTQENFGFTTTIKTSFKPLVDQPFVWMPVTYDITAIGNYLGVKGSFRYLASVSDYKIKLNPNVSHDWVQKLESPPISATAPLVQTEPAKTKPKSKDQQLVEELLNKEVLTKREMLKLASKMKKEAESETQTLLAINDSSELIVDSLAYTRDSSFWEINRPVPLLKEEQISFGIKDTTQKSKSDSTKKAKYKVDWFEVLLSGDSLPSKSKNYYFSFKGPLYGLNLNTVEGVAVEGRFSFGNTKLNAWRYTQTLRMPLERMAFQSVATLSYKFSANHMGYFQIKGGSTILDFNAKGITPWVDAFQLLVFRTNYSKFYQQEFASMFWQRELKTGLIGSVSLFGSNRFALENIDRYQNKEGENGITKNIAIGNDYIQRNQSYQYGLGLSYKPHQLYKMCMNRKIYLANQWPKFTLNYLEGWDTKKQFSRIDFGMTQNVQVRHWLWVNYDINAGFFPYNQRLFFPDYKHFAGNQSFVYQGESWRRFQQLPYYDFSTRNSYQSLFLQLDFKRLILRQLPYLNLISFKEQIYFNALHTADHPLYYEMGYRIDPILGYFSLGVNFHFIENQFKGAGFVMGIRF